MTEGNESPLNSLVGQPQMPDSTVPSPPVGGSAPGAPRPSVPPKKKGKGKIVAVVIAILFVLGAIGSCSDKGEDATTSKPDAVSQQETSGEMCIRDSDVAKAIKELKGGRVEYRADRYGIAHVVLGKVSFTPQQLAENYGAVYDEILRMKPAAAKGKYVKSITVSGTMTPGVSVDSSVTRAYTESAE